MNIKNGQKGFTLPEVMISSVLTIVVVGIIYALFIFSYDILGYALVQGELQEKATSAMEKMIRGVDANYKGIQEAQGITAPAANNSGSTIVFIDQDNSAITRSFALSGDDIIYVNAAGATSIFIEGDVNTLNFTRPLNNDDLVEIQLILQRTFLNKNFSVSISSSIKLRNM